MLRTTYVDRYINTINEVDRGWATCDLTLKNLSDLIDDEIDTWHSLPRGGGTSLHLYLGMTWEEYSRFVETPEALVDILQTIKKEREDRDGNSHH